MSDADVLVIGCGPVGVMTALRCAQRGMSVIAIDASTEIYPLPRAIALDAESQRLFVTAGLGDLIANHTTPMGGAEFLNAAGERVVGFDLPEGFVGPHGHPPMSAFEQPELEHALRDRARAVGVDMRLGVEATAIETHANSVTVSTTVGDVSARWLVGADGASSFVRSALGVEIEDQGFDQPWLVVDTTLLDPALPLPGMAQQICDPERVVTFVPGHRTRRRWEFQLRSDESRDDFLDPERIEALLAPWGSPEQLRLDRAAVYRFHALVASAFRVGPVFLAGDAAHQMPPFNGQGMNSGLRDAGNLAWKLAHVHHGLATDALLDTYELERKPHAVGVVAHSADAGRLIDAIADGTFASAEAGYGGGRPFPKLDDGVVHGDHPAVGRPIIRPIDVDTDFDELISDGWTLIGPGAHEGLEIGPMWTKLGARTVHVESSALPFAEGDQWFAVVRPDRYVAAVGTDAVELSTQLVSDWAV